MRRILAVLAAAALMGAMVVASAAPAMAAKNHHKGGGIILVSDNDFDGNDFGDFDGFNTFGFDGDIDFDGFGGIDQETESGDLETNFSVENTGDFASQCTPALQFGNTGNFNNGSSFVQFDSVADDFEPDGIEFTVEPEQATDCSSTIEQSSAANG